VTREQLEWLADNPLYTKRFTYFVGPREATIDVAKELNLHSETVRELEKQYMAAQLPRAGNPGPKVIGIDEIVCRRPIRLGGCDRSEASMAAFYEVGAEEQRGYRLSAHGHVEAVPADRVDGRIAAASAMRAVAGRESVVNRP